MMPVGGTECGWRVGTQGIAPKTMEVEVSISQSITGKVGSRFSGAHVGPSLSCTSIMCGTALLWCRDTSVEPTQISIRFAR